MTSMEAASKPRDLAGDKAQRIVDAMRESVARRGAAGSTFDHVAREAGVSRGLLHYYFGTKERLLVEVVRRDTELRMAALDAALAGAHTADDFIAALVSSLETMMEEDPDFVTLLFELYTIARRNEEVGREFVALQRATREHVGGLLAAKQAEGVLQLHGEPDAVAMIIFSLADGIAIRMCIEPERDFTAAVRAAVTCARALLTDR
jgi:AcrR family transcriptional regulator